MGFRRENNTKYIIQRSLLWLAFWVVILLPAVVPGFKESNWSALIGGQNKVSPALPSRGLLGQAIVLPNKQRSLSFVSLFLATYQRIPTGELELSLLKGPLAPKDEAEIEGRLLRRKRIQGKEIIDNGRLRWSFKEVRPRDNQGFYLLVSFHPEDQTSGISAWMDNYPDWKGPKADLLTIGANGRISNAPLSSHLMMEFGRFSDLASPLQRVVRRPGPALLLGLIMVITLGLALWGPSWLDRAASARIWSNRTASRAAGVAGLLAVLSMTWAVFYYLQYHPHIDLIDTEAFKSHPWRALLPGGTRDFIHLLGFGDWGPTGFGIAAVMSLFLDLETIYYVLILAIQLCAFVCTWSVYRSYVFSITAAICLGLGSQLSVGYYVHENILSLYFIIIYVLINLTSLYHLFNSERRRRLWFSVYVASLVFMALCAELWVNYLAFLLCFNVYLICLFSHRGETDRLRKSIWLLTTAVVVAGLYLAVRLPTWASSGMAESQFTPGREEALVLSYRSVLTMLEDILSNAVTYTYGALTIFVPLPWLSSASIFIFGKEIAAQNSCYYTGGTEMEHYWFYWRYFAGAIFFLFIYFLVKAIRKSFGQPDARTVSLVAIMLVIATGHAANSIIMYRDALMVLAKTYKYFITIAGASLLWAYGLMRVRSWFRRRGDYLLLVAAVWSLIVYSGLVNQRFFAHQITMFGTSRAAFFPDPVQGLFLLF